MSNHTTAELFNTTTIYTDPDGFMTHADPDCAPGLVECTYEGRGQIACFRCVDLAPIRNGQMEANRVSRAGAAGAGTPIEAGPAEPIEDVAGWLLALGRKVDPSDVTPVLQRAATEWAKAYDGDFQFMLDMQEAAERRALSRGQAKGVLNCWRADLLRQPRQEATEAAGSVPAPSQGVDLSGVPDGRYIVPGGSRRVRIEKPKDGKWAGWVFVKAGSFYGDEDRLGSQRPGALYSGKLAEYVAEIAADPKAAAVEWARQTSSCGLCGAPLEDPASVARGMGPVCMKRFGG